MLEQAIIEQLNSELRRNRLLLKITERELKKLNRLPAGTLVCELVDNHSLKYYRNYIENGKVKRRFIGGPDNELVIDYKKQKFYEMRKTILEKNIMLIERTCKHIGNYSTEAIHKKMPKAYKNLPDECFEDMELAQVKEWLKKYNKRNTYPLPDNPNIACDGTPTRSKGETIIYDDIYHSGLPFQYDVYFKMQGKSGKIHGLSPDFMFICKDGRKVIWEHFGLLANGSYSDENMEKLNKYLDCGFVIGYNLFITSDNVDGNTNELMILETLELIKKRVLFGF